MNVTSRRDVSTISQYSLAVEINRPGRSLRARHTL
jgi:hypothetical protein